jgi:hypothetical protein
MALATLHYAANAADRVSMARLVWKVTGLTRSDVAANAEYEGGKHGT